jgi:hypothetical protein
MSSYEIQPLRPPRIRKAATISVSSGFALSVLFLCVECFLTTRGVTGTLISRFFLYLAGAIVVLFWLSLIWVLNFQHRRRWAIGGLVVIILGAAGVDWITPYKSPSSCMKRAFYANLTDSTVHDVEVSGCFEIAVEINGTHDKIDGIRIGPSLLPSQNIAPEKSYAGNPYLKPGEIGLSNVRSPSPKFDLKSGDTIRFQATYWNSDDTVIPDANVYTRVAVGRADVGHFEDVFLQAFKISVEKAYETDQLTDVNAGSGLIGSSASADFINPDAIESLKAGDQRWKIYLASEAAWKSPYKTKVCTWVSHSSVFKVPIDTSKLNPVVSEVICEKKPSL